eukprot:jgi/Hompol1/932/HPOL_003401-RA
MSAHRGGNRRESSMAGDASHSHTVAEQEEMLRIFFAAHGVTPDDVDNAFRLISRDGKRIMPSDVRAFASKYFDGLPSEVEKMLSGWKEDITRDQLANMLLNRTMFATPWEEAMQAFDGFLDKKVLKKLAGKLNRYGLPGKRDVEALLKKFDKDFDGKIGIEDFKRMVI